MNPCSTPADEFTYHSTTPAAVAAVHGGLEMPPERGMDAGDPREGGPGALGD
jgi:hypothetical protein